MFKGMQIDDKLWVYFKKSPKYESQAERVLRKFGGAKAFVDAATSIGYKVKINSVYKWLIFDKPRTIHCKSKGLGLIPLRAWPMIFESAAAAGIIFTSEDLDPRPVPRNAANYMEKELGAAYLRDLD